MTYLEREQKDQAAKALRAKGMKYEEITRQLGVSVPKAWNMCNRERYRKNTNDSVEKYRRRGRKALYQEDECD